MNPITEMKSMPAPKSWVQGISEHRREYGLHPMPSVPVCVITKEELDKKMRAEGGKV